MSRRMRSHSVPGKYASIRSRQTATGSRNRASRSHGTCATENPVAPRVKTVPLKRKSSGISPSRSACR